MKMLSSGGFMFKKYQNLLLFIFLLFPAILNSVATIDIPLPCDKNGACVAQQYNSWGSIHAPITIIQSDAIADISKIFNPKNISNIFQSHWLKIIIGTTVASYIWILYQIRFTCLLIKQHNSWCNWKSVIPLNHLQLSDHEDLFSQLKFDIGKKYAQQNILHARCDFATVFIQDVHAELNNLNTYLNWYETIQTIYCSRFFNFPFDCATIEDKKARLHFILDLFMTTQAKKI